MSAPMYSSDMHQTCLYRHWTQRLKIPWRPNLLHKTPGEVHLIILFVYSTAVRYESLAYCKSNLSRTVRITG